MTSPSRDSRHDGAFTLLELMLVLAVLLVVAALTVPRLAGSLAALRVSRGTELVFAAAREGRARAVLRGLRTRLVLAPPDGTFWIEEERKPLTAPGRWFEMPGREGKPYALADGARFGTVRVNDEPAPADAVEIRFHADGSADEAVILVENEEGDRGAVEIRGVTGRARIVPADEMDDVLQSASGQRGRPQSTETGP